MNSQLSHRIYQTSHGSHNVYQVIDVVKVIQNSKVPMVLLALDAENVLDLYFLEELFCAFQKMRFGFKKPLRWMLQGLCTAVGQLSQQYSTP